MKILPIYQSISADFTYKITLGGAVYSIRLMWNSRSHNWHITVVDSVGGRIDGVKVVEKWPLLTPHRAQIKLAGDIVALPLTTTTAPLGYANFGTEWVLGYLSATELLTWKAANGLG